MSRSRLRRSLLIFACLAAMVACAGDVIAAAARPNIVLIMTDDQGYGDIGAHGNTMIRTPNLDRLHGRSIRLTDYHVDPTCSPTRSAVLTGRYSTRTGVWHTISGRSLMHSRERTIAELFAAAGYRTGIFGKWHLGDNYPMRAVDQGFGESVVHGGGGIGQTPDYWGNDYFDDVYLHNGRPTIHRGYCTDVFFREAMRFIEANRNQPFFCYIPTNAPHSPYRVDGRYAKPYLDKGEPQPMANFYGMIENIDDNIGRLLARLESLGLTDNTIVIFTTDNGTAEGVAKSEPGRWNGFNAGMRGQKGSPFDGGHRVPFFIRWPAGGIGGPDDAPGRDVKTLAAHIDVLPTLAELCGVTLPEDLSIDGRSLAPLLRGEVTELPPRTLFVHSQRIERPEKWRQSAVMTPRWRLVNGRELYDMLADPAQQRDLAADHPAVVEQLRGEYEAWWRSLSSVFDQHCPIVVGHERADPATLTAHDWHPTDGDTPWHHGMIARPNLYVNGYWVVEVAERGRYALTLRRWPAIVDRPLEAVRVKARVGEAEASAMCDAAARSVTLTVELQPGEQRLQTWLTDAQGRTRGAYFVEVRRVDP